VLPPLIFMSFKTKQCKTRFFAQMNAMRNAISFLFLFLGMSVGAYGQIYTTIRTTSDAAKTAFQEGKNHAERGEFAVALGYFESALKKDPDLIDARLALADTWVSMSDFFKAERFFEEALAQDTLYAPVAFFFLAQVEWQLEKYSECAAHCASYLNNNPRNPRNQAAAKRLLASARFADNATKNPVPFDPKSVGNGINTADLEYFPSLTVDGQTMIFTRQSGGDENFFSSQWRDGQWQTAVPIDAVNTNQNEGAQAISPDGTWLVFTACNRYDDGSLGSCDLYWSQEKGNGWTKPVPFSNVINSEYWEAQPSIGADNKTLIFTSGRPGTQGKYDLWITQRQAGGKWKRPERLGAGINTGGSEHLPFLHPDGQTLYFSSDSLPGMGGDDIFMARRQADGTWSTPQNLGYPINTKAHEGMLVVSLDGRTAYYASDRPGGQGGLDIYSFELPEAVRPLAVTYARARVTDANTGYPITAKLDFVDLATGQSYVSVNAKSDGTALACLPAGRNYALNVSKKNYLFYSENFNLTVATAENPFQLNVALQPIRSDSATTTFPAGKPIVLNNIFFETGSALLLSTSNVELERLSELLRETPTLRIQINGHTDNVGNDADNQKLSEARAKAVYDTLMSKGITAERLRFKGFGESKPVQSNDTQEGRTLNRRTEFEVW
jgi:outer membrane protein OmpA-like peptidoglycan-associated protein/tetratricopeptide (TPR) repeat protein